MNMKQTHQASLDSVLLDFRVESADGPKPVILELYCRKYPQYARDLTDYAIQWLIGDALAATEPGHDVAPAASSSLVSRAISRFHDRVLDQDAAKETAAQPSAKETRNPFEGLSVARKRAIRDQLGISTPLLAKFQNRLIDPDTAPLAFLERFARLVESAVDEFVGYLRLPPMMHAAPEFMAEGKPALGTRKETFEEAVRGSSLDERRKQALLKG